MPFNELLSYLKVIIVLALFIGIPIFIAIINANYVKESDKDDDNVELQKYGNT